MYMAYCPNCKKETGYKRSIGFGTLFAVILTGGLWLIAILFYPTRCAVCGGSKSTRKPHPEANKTDETKLVNIEEYQNWAEEFIYQFDRDVTKVSSNPGTPVKDYDILLSFFDTIKEKSLDTPSIRGLENKKVFEQTFSKAQNLFDELAKTPEVQNLLCQQETARVEREQLEQQKADIAAEASAKFKRSVVTVGAFLILGLVLVLTYMDYRSSMAEAEKRQQANTAVEAKRAEEKTRQWRLANKAEEEKWQAQLAEEKRQAQEKIDIERATDGDADAQYRVGERYYTGKGVSMNYSEALKWYQKAADMGHAKAQYSIGWMYLVGYGVTKDKTLAMKWFKKAADQGDESAKAALLKFQ
jgi:hypothetical protein